MFKLMDKKIIAFYATNFCFNVYIIHICELGPFWQKVVHIARCVDSGYLHCFILIFDKCQLFTDSVSLLVNRNVKGLKAQITEHYYMLKVKI